MSPPGEKIPRSSEITILRSTLAGLGIFVYEYEAMPEFRGAYRLRQKVFRPIDSMKTVFTIIVTLFVCVTQAQLSVTVSPPKLIGQKADIPMEFKNSLDKNVESVRAVTFLLDENGKVIAQATRWIIGGGQAGKTNSDLPANTARTVHFVVGSDKPFATTNLTAKVNFTRIVLEGGRLLDAKEVQVKTPQK